MRSEYRVAYGKGLTTRVGRALTPDKSVKAIRTRTIAPELKRVVDSIFRVIPDLYECFVIRRFPQSLLTLFEFTIFFEENDNLLLCWRLKFVWENHSLAVKSCSNCNHGISLCNRQFYGRRTVSSMGSA